MQLQSPVLASLPSNVRLQAMEDGMTKETIFEYTKIDPWFLTQLDELHEAEQWLKTQSLDSISCDDLLATKQRGFSDAQIARCLGESALQQFARTKVLSSSVGTR